MDRFQEIEKLIQATMAKAIVRIEDLTGTQDHLGLTIISKEFEGKLPIDQHQMIMDILKAEIDSGRIHAVQLKTMTPEKAQRKGLM